MTIANGKPIWNERFLIACDILHLGVACHHDPEHVTQFTKHQTNNTCRGGADLCGYMTLHKYFDVMLLLSHLQHRFRCVFYVNIIMICQIILHENLMAKY